MQTTNTNKKGTTNMKCLKAYTILMFGILIGIGVCQWIELLLTK